MKKASTEQIIFNMDKVPVADMATCRFLLDFDERQELYLRSCLDHGYPIDPIAYRDLPAERMCDAYSFAYGAAENPYADVHGTPLTQYHHKYSDKEFYIWKAVHAGLTDAQFTLSMLAAGRDEDLLSIPNIYEQSTDIWKAIVYGIYCCGGEDLSALDAADFREKIRSKDYRMMVRSVSDLASHDILNAGNVWKLADVNRDRFISEFGQSDADYIKDVLLNRVSHEC